MDDFLLMQLTLKVIISESKYCSTKSAQIFTIQIIWIRNNDYTGWSGQIVAKFYFYKNQHKSYIFNILLKIKTRTSTHVNVIHLINRFAIGQNDCLKTCMIFLKCFCPWSLIPPWWRSLGGLGGMGMSINMWSWC